MSQLRIVRLTTAVSGEVEATLDDGTREPYTSTSEVIQMALGTAFAVGAPVRLETVSEKSRVIERIEAFDIPPTSPVNVGTITRLATQRFGDPAVHILEVFILTDPKNTVQYRVIDAAVQRVCHAAALARARITFDYAGGELTFIEVDARPPV